MHIPEYRLTNLILKPINELQSTFGFALTVTLLLSTPWIALAQPLSQNTESLSTELLINPVAREPLTPPSDPINARNVANESQNTRADFDLSLWIERAISQHPSVLQALAQEQALTQELESARWQYWPNLIVSGDVTKDGPGSTIAAEVPLWTAGRLSAQTDQAQANLSAQSNAVQATRYTIAEQVVDAWTLAAQSAGRVRVLDETLKTLSRYESIMERRVKAEISPRVELDLLRARLGETRVNRTNADAQGHIAVRRLKLLADQYVAWPEWKQASLLNEAQKLPKPNDTSDGENHPVVLRSIQEMQAAEAELNKYKAEKWPEIYAGAQTSVGRELLQEVPELYLGLRYETGRGLSKSSQSNAAGARAQAALLAVGDQRLKIAEDLQVYRQNWLNAVERLQHLSKAQHASNSVVSSYERQFIAGKRTWQDVLNSVRENSDNALSINDTQAQMISSWWHIQILTSSFAWQNLSDNTKSKP